MSIFNYVIKFINIFWAIAFNDEEKKAVVCDLYYKY